MFVVLSKRADYAIFLCGRRHICFHTISHVWTHASLTILKCEIFMGLQCALVVLSLPYLELCTCEQTTQDVSSAKHAHN